MITRRLLIALYMLITTAMTEQLNASLVKQEKSKSESSVFEPHCGYQNPDGLGFKVTGGREQEVLFGEFPWMVALIRDVDGEPQVLQCGGALLAPQVVLTASHCVHKRLPSEVIARAGEWNIEEESEIFAHQDVKVKEIIVHEDFDSNNFHNDIALLILENAFELIDHIQPICLPDVDAKFEGARCYVTGWGQDKFGKGGNYSAILKQQDLPIVPFDSCLRHLRKTHVGKKFELHEDFICAGGEAGKDACTGDSGAPLFCPIQGTKHRFVQVGVVALGLTCGAQDVPGVYANVATLRPWINEKLAARKVDFKYFTPTK